MIIKRNYLMNFSNSHSHSSTATLGFCKTPKKKTNKINKTKTNKQIKSQKFSLLLLYLKITVTAHSEDNWPLSTTRMIRVINGMQFISCTTNDAK